MPGPIQTRHASVTVDELIGSAYPIVKKVAQNIANVKRVSEHISAIDGVFEHVQHIYGIYNNIDTIAALAVNINGIIAITNHFDEIMEIYTSLPDILNAAANVAAAVSLAQAWATNDFGIPVQTGAYSAKHWAIISQNSADSSTSAATTATTQAGIATTKAGEAAASATAANTSAGTATTQAGISTTKAGEAAASATTASTQAGISTTKAGEAAASATTATTQAGISTTQAGISTTKAGEAAASAATALSDKNLAVTAKTESETARDLSIAAKDLAVTAKTAAETAAGTATTQAGIATTKAGEANTSAGTATTQAGIATTKAGEASTFATTATTQAGISTTKAGEADTSATTASTQAGIATTKAGEADTSATNAAATLTSFSAKYLGAKSSDPTLDNAGVALIDGVFYWNTTLKALRFYDLGTTTWSTSAGGGGGGGTADLIVYNPATSGLSATTVQAALDEVDGILDGVKTKTNWITVTQAVDLDAIETASNLVAGIKVKTDWITITQSVDLDAIEDRVNALDAAIILKGAWDASAGTFPGGGTAQAGESWIVSVAGTVGGIAFAVNDRLIAILDNASTTTFASNWFKADYTDQVLSVAGKTGALTLQVADITDMSANGRSLMSAADYAAMKVLLAYTKSDVGLGNVDNTSDATKFDNTAGRIRGRNRQTGTTYTFVLTDAGKLVEGNNASVQTYTVPPNSTTAFVVGETVINVGQYGAGQITIAAGAGVTIRSSGAKLKLSGQYSTAALVKIGTDEWWLFGDIAA